MMHRAASRAAPAGLSAALESYTARTAREAADVERIRALVRAGDPWSRGTSLHVTGSALVVDASSLRVLLRWHARLGSWAQVGGHADPGETDPWRVALREAAEETGLRDLRALPGPAGRIPLQIVIVPVAARGAEPAHEHADIRYLLSTSRPELAAAESPRTPVRWLPFEEALEQVAEDNLRELLERARYAGEA